MELITQTAAMVAGTKVGFDTLRGSQEVSAPVELGQHPVLRRPS